MRLKKLLLTITQRKTEARLNCGCGCGDCGGWSKLLRSALLSIPSPTLNPSFLSSLFSVLQAAEITAEMGVDPVKLLPVQAGVGAVEVSVLEAGYRLANDVAWKPTAGNEARHRCFEPGRWLREKCFVRGTENGARHGGEVREVARVTGWWRRRWKLLGMPLLLPVILGG